MEENEDEPNDVQKATPVEEEITRGEIDEHSGKPTLPIELAKKRHHCEKDSAKKIKKSLKNEGECCRSKLANATKGHSKTATVLVYEKECTLPKIKPIPRHCLTKDEWIDLLATPSRKCPSPCLQREVTRKIRPVSTRMAELAQPPKNRLLNTLQDRAATLPTELVDHLIQTLEGEACLTPEQAERMFRDKDIRGRKKCRKRKSRLSCKGSSSKSSKRDDPEIPANNSGFDKEAVNCQYMMAESFVRSILDWKCPIPKEEFKDIAEVILKRLGYVLEYNPVNGEDRKSQQMRFLADVVASWISGVIFDVATARREEMEKECERKRNEKEEESEEESDDESEDEEDDDGDDDEGGGKKKGGRDGPPGGGGGRGGGKDDKWKKGEKDKKDDEDDDKKGGKPANREEEKKADDSEKTKSQETLKTDDGKEPTEQNVEQVESRPVIKDSKDTDEVLSDARGGLGLDFDEKMTQGKQPEGMKIDETIDLGSETKNALTDDFGNELRGEAMGKVAEEIGDGTKIGDDSQGQRFIGVTKGSEKEETLIINDKDETKAREEVTGKATAISKEEDKAKTAKEAAKEANEILNDKVADKPKEIFAEAKANEEATGKVATNSKDGDEAKTAKEAAKEATKMLDDKEEAKKGKMDDKVADKPKEIFAEAKANEKATGKVATISKDGDEAKTAKEAAKEATEILDDKDDTETGKMDDKVADKPKEIFAEAKANEEATGKVATISKDGDEAKTAKEAAKEVTEILDDKDEAKKGKMDDKIGNKPKEIFAGAEIGPQLGRNEIAAATGSVEKTGVEVAVNISESQAEPAKTEAIPAAMVTNIVPEKIFIDSAEKEDTVDNDTMIKEAEIDDRAAGDRKDNEKVTEVTKAPAALKMMEKQLVEVGPIVAEGIGKKIHDDMTLSSTLEDSTSPIVFEEPETTLKKDKELTKIPTSLSETTKDKHEILRKMPSKIPSNVVKRKNLQTDTHQLVTFDQIFHKIYNAIEASGENSGIDAITNRLHRAVYEKCSNVCQEEKKEPLTDLTKDVLDVMSGKIALWLRDVLTDTQLSFINKFPATVESKDVREWTKWMTNVSETANTWSTWIQETIRKFESMRAGKITRGDWQDWTKSVEEDVLLWRRFYVQSLHEAHHNLTMIRDRQIVKTGTRDVNGDYEEEIKITDLEVDH